VLGNAGVLGLAAGLSACTTTHSVTQRVSITQTDSPLGKTITYGGLQVSVPKSWSVAPLTINQLCANPIDRTVIPEAFTRLGAASCPSAPAKKRPRQAVISCSYGTARQPPGTPNESYRSGGTVLRSHENQGTYTIYLGSSSAVAIDVPGDPALAESIAHSVQPSGGHC
jgi:hypothetical protein